MAFSFVLEAPFEWGWLHIMAKVDNLKIGPLCPIKTPFYVKS
jgi:hypothetical protein